MIPKKIYLRENELEEQFMCERMVSCDASIGSCNVEYTDISQVWHDASEEPKDCSKLLIYFEHEYGKMDCKIYNHVYWTDLLWREVVYLYHIKQWAYISDLLPKRCR